MFEWFKKLFKPKYKPSWVLIYSYDLHKPAMTREFFLREEANHFVEIEQPLYWSIGKKDKDGEIMSYESSYYNNLRKSIK